MNKGQFLEIIKNLSDNVEIRINGSSSYGTINNVSIDYDCTEDFKPVVVIDYEE